MLEPITLSDIRIITVSGRIGAGSTTLARGIAKILGWKRLEGGDIFWEAVRKRLGLDPKDTDLRPDEEDRLFDAQLKKILNEDKDIVLETKLAAYNAQSIPGIFKILVVCEDRAGVDQTAIRIDRLVNRERISVDEAKVEVMEREEHDLAKWRKLYADKDQNWVYWDKAYYDLVINTFSNNQEEALQVALEGIEYKKA